MNIFACNIPPRRYFTSLSVVLFVLFASRVVLPAANRYWVGGASNDWNNTANWSTTSGVGSGASVPGGMDQAIFDAGSGANTTITTGIPGTVQGLTVSNNYQLTLQNATILTLTNGITVTGGGTAQCIISAGQQVIIAGNCTLSAGAVRLVVNGKLTINNGITLTNNAMNGVSVGATGELEMDGNSIMGSNSPLYAAGAKLTYSGSAAKSVGLEFLPTMLPGVIITINNTNAVSGITIGTNRTVQGILRVNHGRRLTLSASPSLSINGTNSMPIPGGKIQIEGSPILVGVNTGITYDAVNIGKDTLEFIGTQSHTISAGAKEFNGGPNMNGTIVLNKPPGSSVDGIAGTLQVNGSFLMKQGIWNNNAGGILQLNGVNNIVSNGATLVAKDDAVIEVINPQVLVNDGIVRIDVHAVGPPVGGTLRINGIASVTGTNPVTYMGATSILLYQGNNDKMTTSIELPGFMTGAVSVNKMIATQTVSLNESKNILGAVTIVTGVLRTEGNTLQVSGGATINAMGTLLLPAMPANGVVYIPNGQTITNSGTFTLNGGNGTLRYA